MAGCTTAIRKRNEKRKKKRKEKLSHCGLFGWAERV
jgi:hypothetical protein